MARKVPDDKRGKKKPSASATRSPGGGEAARRKAATAYTKSPVGQARSPKGRAKNKRNKEIAFAALSAVPVAGAAGKAVKVVSASRNVKTVKNLYNQATKAKYKAKYGKDAVPEANRAMRNLSQKRYSSEKLVKKVYGEKPSPAQAKELKSAYARAERLQNDLTKNYKSDMAKLKSSIKENKNSRGYNLGQKDLDKSSSYARKFYYKHGQGKKLQAYRASARSGHYYARAMDDAYTKGRAGFEMELAKYSARKVLGKPKKPLPSTTKQSPMVPVVGAGAAAAKAKGLRDAKRRPSNTGSVRSRPKPAPRKPKSSGMRARPLPKRP